MSHVVMLLTNPFQPDPRVLKEARTLVSSGYRVTVLAWDREGIWPSVEQFDGIEIVRLRGARSTYGAGFRQMFRLPVFWRQAWSQLDILYPAVVHCHDFDTLPLGWAWAKHNGKPVIYDAHEYYADLQRPRLTGAVGKVLLAALEQGEQWLSRRTNAIITVDSVIAARYRHPRVVIIGHYPPKDFVDPVRVDRIPHSILVYAGRLSTDRGLLKLVQAMQVLATEGLHPRLRLMGRWSSEREEQDFWQACRGLEEQIEMIGWVPFSAVGEQIAAADIAIALLQPIPRYVKAMPIKLFEYMACAKPVVISDFPAIRQVLRDANAGILLNPTDVTAISDALRLLLLNPDAGNWLGKQGRDAFALRYNWETLEPLLLNLYAELAPQESKQT